MTTSPLAKLSIDQIASNLRAVIIVLVLWAMLFYASVLILVLPTSQCRSRNYNLDRARFHPCFLLKRYRRDFSPAASSTEYFYTQVCSRYFTRSRIGRRRMCGKCNRSSKYKPKTNLRRKKTKKNKTRKKKRVFNPVPHLQGSPLHVVFLMRVEGSQLYNKHKTSSCTKNKRNQTKKQTKTNKLKKQKIQNKKLKCSKTKKRNTTKAKQKQKQKRKGNGKKTHKQI